jgi:hypothetical protein
MIFAQVASGGGWSTDITIGNTSAAPQTVRIDFFASGFTPVSVVDITIQPRGLFVFSLDSAGVSGQ